MASVATVTRTLYIPNIDPSGGALASALNTVLTDIAAQNPTMGPFKWNTIDNMYLVIEVQWPSASDTAFMSAASLATLASTLGLPAIQTEVYTSTSLY
jgi:hypothetical protein